MSNVANSERGPRLQPEIEHGLPASLDAERSVLGAVLLDHEIFGQASTLISHDDFSLDSHRRIYRAMDEMLDRGTPVDLVMLSETLARKKELESVGGVTYLATLTEGLPRRDNIEHYVKIVRDKAMLRSIIHMSKAAESSAFDRAADVDEVLEQLQQKLLDVVFHGKKGTGVDVREAARQTFEQLSAIRLMTGACIGIPTGLTEVDELTTGFREKEFYVVGARPGNGKTAWMCQSARAAIRAGFKPGIFSVEVPKEQIVARLACQERGLTVFDTRDTRYMNDVQWNELTEAIAEVGTWNYFLEDSPRMTVKQLAAIARMWVSKGCDVIYVDFLQKLSAPGNSEYDRVTEIAKGLWELARSTEVPVVSLSQLSRLPKGDRDRPPTMEDLRSSGEIEQNANAVGLLHRPSTVDDEDMRTFTGDDQFILAKQRSGPAGVHVRVWFDGKVGLYRPRHERPRD